MTEGGEIEPMRRQLTYGDVRRANLPELFWGASMKAIPDALPYKQRVEKYLAQMPEMVEHGVGLYLWSNENSSGKTSIAALIVKEALRCGFTAFFEESGRLKTRLMNKDEFEEGTSVLERTGSVDLLVLDDIGKEYRTSSGYAENAVETLLRGRVQRKQVTVMTGNVNPRDLKKLYSEDFAALLKESMVPIEVSGHDFRDARAKELQALL